MMEKSPVDRRDFLRLCVVAAGSVVAAACQKTLQNIASETEVVGTSTVLPSPSPAVKVNLTGADQDVWMWVKTAKVGVTGECESLVVYVNGREFETQSEGETFTAEVKLSSGENRVSATCRQSNGGEIQSNMLNYTERLRQAPKAVIHIALDSDRIILDGGKSQPAEADGSVILDHIWSPRPGNPASLAVEGAAGLESRPFTDEVSTQTVILLPPTTDGEYYVQLKVKDSAGRDDEASIYFVVEQGKARIPDYDKENPAWIETAVVYGVIPSKFGQPAFQAITKRLDDLAELGVNALWLAPINVSPPGDYGYAVVDYFDLNHGYGTKEDFHRLVQEAHARGIRVLMDFVPNHSSAQHPYFLSAKDGGPRSPYWDFYDRDASGEPTHYFDWTHLPNLNYENPEVRNMMIEAFAYWVREFDVDGFRVDACWGVKQRRPDFWPQWRKELKRIKPDLMLLAEASARDPYYFDNGFDVAYDWTDQLGHWAWQVVWDTYKLRLLSYNLTDALTNGRDGFHPDALIFRFLNNNDTGERFIKRHGEGVTRVATALLLTLPGVPCIYTGDELGEEFKPYEDSGPLSWIERVPGLQDYHKQLIALRHSQPSLHSRSWRPLTLEATRDQVAYGYLRYHDEQEDPILVLLNFNEEPTEIAFASPDGFPALEGKSSLKDLLSGESVAVEKAGEGWKVAVPGYSVRLLTAATA
ncbi:MAG TPA: alpha-amylase family glycosyl hydrolase [Anaerolineales bacterium]